MFSALGPSELIPLGLMLCNTDMLSQFYIARSKSARARGHATAAPSYDCRRPACVSR